jgi:hypothetical protein
MTPSRNFKLKGMRLGLLVQLEVPLAVLLVLVGCTQDGDYAGMGHIY